MDSIEYLNELKKDYEYWNEVYKNGCSDPNWADGMNLNLIRNHIMYDKRMLEESLPYNQLPELYFKELPPKVDFDYIARPTEIMYKAVEYYETCTSTEGWNKLIDAFDFLDSKNPEQESMRFFIRRIKWLKECIDSKNYVSMRLFKDVDEAVDKIHEYAEKLDNMELHRMEQISLFQM